MHTTRPLYPIFLDSVLSSQADSLVKLSAWENSTEVRRHEFLKVSRYVILADLVILPTNFKKYLIFYVI